MEICMNELKIITMQHQTDCEVAAIATALQISYDEAKSALRWQKLPFNANNPIYGNPWNLYRALIKLGFWKKNVTLTDLLSFRAEPGKTVVLIHDPQNPTLKQHWVTWHGRAGDLHALAWGDSQQLRCIHDYQLISYFRKGWPNCAFTVYKANALHLLFRRIESIFRG